MNHYIEKILYLGAGLLLFAMALTFFFSGYDLYQDHLHQAERLMLSEPNIHSSEKSVSVEVSGDEVLHQVLDRRKRFEEAKVYSHYGQVPILSKIECPMILVEGVKAEELELSFFNEAHSFNVTYDINPSGKITLIRYTKK